MSSPADPITQLGEVLATAEHHVQQIVAAAEQRADERLRAAQQRLDARASELNGIADELLTASAAVHHQLQRLRSLVPLEAMPDEPAASPPAPTPLHAAPPQAAAPPSSSPPPAWPAPLARSADPAASAAPPAAAPPGPAPAPWPEPLARPSESAAPLPPEPAAPPTAAPVDPPPAERVGSAPTADVPSHDHDLPLIDSSEPYETPEPTAEQLDSARLVALSMAAGGRSRTEVEAHLRHELGITDYGPLIDYVFGISTPASVVPSWPPRRRRREG